MKAALIALALLTWPAVAQEAAVIPDPLLTPGSVRTTNLGDICFEGTRQYRHPHGALEIMRSYGLPPEARNDYTLDHLVPLELGGADDIKNLWPEPRRSLAPIWDDERKDELEHKLHTLVCNGDVDIDVAQRAFEDDWTEGYKHWIGEPQPVASGN